MKKTQFVMDTKPLKGMLKQLEQFQKVDMNKFMEDCARVLAARLLSRIIKRTPVYQKDGGALRRGWTGGKRKSAESYAKTVPIYKNSKNYFIFLYNPIKYAPYVEYGHRQEPGRFVPGEWVGTGTDRHFEYKQGHKTGMVLKERWAKGIFMMTISAKEVEDLAPALIEKMLLAKMREAFK